MSVVGGIVGLMAGIIREPEGVIVGPEPPTTAPSGGPEFQFDDPVNSQNVPILG